MKIVHKKEDASNSNDDFEYLGYMYERLINVEKIRRSHNINVILVIVNQTPNRTPRG